MNWLKKHGWRLAKGFYVTTLLALAVLLLGLIYLTLMLFVSSPILAVSCLVGIILLAYIIGSYFD